MSNTEKQRDTDGDGVGDACDNCPCDYNPGQKTDPAGTGLACLDREPGDADGDGIDDPIADPAHPDNCPCTANSSQTDANPPDGVGDDCQECGISIAEYLVYGNAASGRFATVRPPGGKVRDPLTWGNDRAIETGKPNAGEYPDVFFRTLKETEYELKDHLGNVRVVVSDLKQTRDPDGVAAGQSGQWPFDVDMVAFNNYYPFGMLHSLRHWRTKSYRYGFNGKEMDDEVQKASPGSGYDATGEGGAL